MIGSDRFWAGRKKLICLWIILLFQLINTVSHSRRYDKCTTGDGRQGVCVVKRYCREASQHELLLCEDEENHCCPIPTTQRSAQVFPRPREDESHPPRTVPNTKEKQRPPVEIRDHDRDERLNKTPPPNDRRSHSGHNNDRTKYLPNSDKTDIDDSDRRKSYRPEEPKEDPPNRSRVVPQSRPVSKDQPQQSKPTHVEPPKEYDRIDPPARRPDSNRFYPPKDDLESTRVTSPPPRRVSHDSAASKNRTRDDSAKAPIRFPETYEFSVPRPKVPACGVKPYDLFIAGGQESREHEWPWMTAIFRRFPDSRPKTFLCGGSLINTKYVVTAAHCFVNNYVILPASAFIVRLGSHFLDSGEDYTVSNLVIHHNHSGSDYFNDIALVRLASEVYITDKIAPICLPPPDMIMENFVGRLATVSGWGDTAFRTGGSRILQHVTVPIVSGEECFAAYSRVRGAAFLARGSDHVICAGLREGGKDACLGDSGGPLMIKMSDDRWIVVGIVSLGYKCAEPGYPGVYTRVTHYLSWINTNMKRH